MLSGYNPKANIHPKPDKTQTKIAVVKLNMLLASFLNIIPAPIKPEPQTTCAIILAGSPPTFVEIKVKIKAPRSTNIVLLTPITLWDFSLSEPSRNPTHIKIIKLIIRFIF